MGCYIHLTDVVYVYTVFRLQASSASKWKAMHILYYGTQVHLSVWKHMVAKFVTVLYYMVAKFVYVLYYMVANFVSRSCIMVAKFVSILYYMVAKFVSLPCIMVAKFVSILYYGSQVCNCLILYGSQVRICLAIYGSQISMCPVLWEPCSHLSCIIVVKFSSLFYYGSQVCISSLLFYKVIIERKSTLLN